MIDCKADTGLASGGCWLSVIAGLVLSVAAWFTPIYAEDETAPRETEAPSGPGEPQQPLKYSCRVVDETTGQGLSGARVTIRRGVETAPPEQVVARELDEMKLTTDANGDYHFFVTPQQLAEPELWLQVDVECHGYAPNESRRTPLTAIRKRELAGKRPEFEVIKLAAGKSVTGLVVDPEGKPVPDVFVQAYSRRGTQEAYVVSWSSTATDTEGRFRFEMLKKGIGIVWVYPETFAPVERYVEETYSDLGEIRLSSGVRATVRVIDVNGRPIPETPVYISFTGPRSVGELQTIFSVRRNAVSAADGSVTFAPLSPGQYRVNAQQTSTTQRMSNDQLIVEQRRYGLKAIFLPQRVVLPSDSPTASFEFQAQPSVKLHFRFRDSEGNGVKVRGAVLAGTLDQHVWTSVLPEGEDGSVTLIAPHGLHGTQLRLPASSEYAYRYRAGPNEPLNGRFHRVALPALDDDLHGVEIIRYQSPILRVSAVDEAQNPVEKLTIKALYAMPRPPRYIIIQNGGDIRFETRDNKEYSSTQMLPDEDVTLTITAEGYSPLETKVNLKERQVKDLKVTLSKVPAT